MPCICMPCNTMSCYRMTCRAVRKCAVCFVSLFLVTTASALNLASRFSQTTCLGTDLMVKQTSGTCFSFESRRGKHSYFAYILFIIHVDPETCQKHWQDCGDGPAVLHAKQIRCQRSQKALQQRNWQKATPTQHNVRHRVMAMAQNPGYQKTLK